MNDKIFNTLWGEALTAADRDAYVSDWALSSIWDDDPGAEIPEDRIEAVGRIWDAAHTSIRDIVAHTGLTQAAFAVRHCIPLRTVENWCRDVSKCTDYTRLMMLRLEEIL